jgi:hypothetical protein
MAGWDFTSSCFTLLKGQAQRSDVSRRKWIFDSSISFENA